MKNSVNNFFIVVLVLAVTVLYAIIFCNRNKEDITSVYDNDQESDTTVIVDETGSDSMEIDEDKMEDMAIDKSAAKSDIAYINEDSLLENYRYAKDLNALFLKEENAMRAQFKGKADRFRKDYAELSARAQKGLMSKDEQLRAEQRLQQQQQELQRMDNTLSKQVLDKRNAMNKKLNDKVMAFLKEYNKEKHYKIIIGINDILYPGESQNITKDVLIRLNKEYKR